MQSAVASSGGGAGSGQAAAGSGRTVLTVHGTQVPVDPDNGVYRMRGDLVGRWVAYAGRVLHNDPTLFVLSGKERFNGCVDKNHDKRCGSGERAGRMNFAFLYWASFDKDGNLIRGQCTHPVTGGTRGFTGARGLLHMVDKPVGDSVRTTYRGRLVLHGGPARTAATSRGAVARSAVSTSDPGRALAC
jgi:hypothetical protein